MKTAYQPANAPGVKRYTCRLSQADGRSDVGAKARTLGRMMNFGIPVPSGFVALDGAFQEFLACNDLPSRINRLCDGVDRKSPPSLQSASQAIRTLVVNAKIPPHIDAEIALCRQQMFNDATLIVRSSAMGEDSREASFAGQLDSFLNVKSVEDLRAALLSCWASYWSERSLFYQLSRSVRLRGMGVIFQEMIFPIASGVLFTVNPDAASNDQEKLLVEYCHGHAEPLVSGKVNPGRFTISRSDFGWQRHSAPEQPLDWRAEQLLFRRATLSSLARLGLSLEKELGGPQDIEWAIDAAGNLFLVQSRPITTQPFSRPTFSHSWQTDAKASGLQRVVVWSNANVNENFPDPISPLLYSIASTGYYYYFRNLAAALGIAPRRIYAMEHRLRNIIGVHGGRMYYNLTNIHAALSMAPFSHLLVDDFNRFVGATEKPQLAHNPPSEFKQRFGRWVELGVVAINTAWQYLFLPRRVRQFEHMVSEYAARTEPETLPDRSLQELLEDLHGFLDIRFHRWTHAALADAASMVCYGALKRFVLREFPHADEASLHNTLLKGLRDIVSSIPALKIWELSRTIRQNFALSDLFKTTDSARLSQAIESRGEFSEFRRELNGFLNDWGFRCSGELMLTKPSFQEDPTALFDILKGYIGMEDSSPEQMIFAQHTDREAQRVRVLEELRGRRPFRFLPFLTSARIANLLLHWTHRSISLRERARLKQALLYSRCRRVALAIGEKLTAAGQLERSDDIFFLTYQELDQLLCGSAMFPYHTRELVARRKKEHAELSAINPPDSMELAEGIYLPRQNESSPATRKQQSSEPSSNLEGTSACGGTVIGRATILNDISESAALQSGDILVARQTDPGWGPVFFLIRGLVLERGGMLSHGAIIAREFGIPSVVGVKNATRQIPQGRRICVNGNRGVITVLD